jgi:uncharacterized membrane protein YcaP (DUF421 family)
VEDLIGVALRVSNMYLNAQALLRFSGKRTIGDLSAFDFVITTALGDLFDDVIWAEVPVSQGVVAMATMILLHSLVGFASSQSRAIHDLVASAETLVVRKGRLFEQGMRRERTPEEEVLPLLRVLGVDKRSDVEEAAIEPSGEPSVIKKPEERNAQKQDLPRLKKVLRGR